MGRNSYTGGRHKRLKIKAARPWKNPWDSAGIQEQDEYLTNPEGLQADIGSGGNLDSVKYPLEPF